MERSALVKGGTRGLGKAVALALRDAGNRVAAAYHTDDEAARRMQHGTGYINGASFDVNGGQYLA